VNTPSFLPSHAESMIYIPRSRLVSRYLLNHSAMLIHSLLLATILFAISVNAQQPIYAQCGGG
jgi:hypothetical protein